MSEKTPLQDLVVILPGILGSVLQKDNKDLWAVSTSMICSLLLNRNKLINTKQ
jgi:hypothetical protein